MGGIASDLALCGQNAQSRDLRITESEADVDGTAACSFRIFTSTRQARSRPKPLGSLTQHRCNNAPRADTLEVQGAYPAPA